MAVGKRMMTVIEIGTVPTDLVIIQPGGAELGLETFAEAAFGLRIDVDAFDDVGIHVNSSVLRLERSGRLKVGAADNGAERDCGRLADAFERSGWKTDKSSQCGLVARFNLRR